MNHQKAINERLFFICEKGLCKDQGLVCSENNSLTGGVNNEVIGQGCV
jgi:hypothetical protein